MDKLNKAIANIGDMNLKRRVKTIVEKLAVTETDRILDCGCGDGLFLVAIRQISNCRLYGMDIDKTNLRLAKKYLQNKSVKLVCADIAKMPFENGFFNKIYCTEVLEHVPDDKKAVLEIRRVLKKDGILIITVPHHNYPFFWDPINKILETIDSKHIQSGFWAGIWNQHLRLYSLNEAASLIKAGGFKIEEKMALTHYCIPFNHLILYGLRQLLTSGLLPEKLSRTADKFRWQEKNQSKIIKLGYKLLNQLDKLNDKVSLNHSSVNILIKAKKV